MTRYWALGLLLAATAVVYLVRWLLARQRPSASVDIALDEPVRRQPEVMRFVEDDDTAPAVLSSPEWKPPPKKAA